MQVNCLTLSRRTSLTVHCYADNTQLYMYVSFSPNKSIGQFEAVTAIQHCVDDIRNWMTNDKLLLNDDKTEFLMIGTKQQLAKVSIDHNNWRQCNYSVDQKE